MDTPQPYSSQRRHHGKMILMPFIIIVLVFLSAYLVSLTRNSWKEYNYVGKSPEFKDRISIEGTGKVSAASDIATVNIGLISEKSNVADAQNENSEIMNRIINELKTTYSIEDKDIQTNNYQIYPRYKYDLGVSSIIGYTVSQTVNIKVRDFTKIGEIIAMAGSSGSNSVSGPYFSIDDLDQYKTEAREKAIIEAREKAKILAKDLGISLGPIVNFSESEPYLYPIYDQSMNYSRADGIGGGKVAPDIQAGSDEISVTVYLSYEIW